MWADFTRVLGGVVVTADGKKTRKKQGLEHRCNKKIILLLLRSLHFLSYTYK